MKFVANPVEVDAFVIVSMKQLDAGNYPTPAFKLFVGEPQLAIDTPVEQIALQEKLCDSQMTARYTPKVGDYFVIQSDGYEYINPKDVFERKYRAA